MLQRLIPVAIALSTVLAVTAGAAHAQRYEDRDWDRRERIEHERWERLHRHGRPYAVPGYYAPPVYDVPPVRQFYAPPPIYQAPGYGYAVPYR